MSCMEVGMLPIRSHKRPSLIRGLVAILAFGGCVWTAGAPAGAQQLGQLYISILDSENKPVTDLEIGDINVLVDDVECQVITLEPVTKPTKLTVMVDNGPVTTRELATYRSALRAFFEALPPDIETSLYTINPQPRTIVKATTDRQKLLQGIDLIAPDSGA